MKTPKIPATDSIQDLANFWDKHDLTDFEDLLEEIPEPVFERHGRDDVTNRQPAIEEDFQIKTEQAQPRNAGSIAFEVVVKDRSKEQNTLARVTTEFTLSGRRKFGDDFLRLDAEKSAIEYVKNLLKHHASK